MRSDMYDGGTAVYSFVCSSTLKFDLRCTGSQCRDAKIGVI